MAFFFLLTGAIMPTTSQDSQSSLVVFIDSPAAESTTLRVSGVGEALLNRSKWLKGLPAYREFFLPPKEYTLKFPGPVKSVGIGTATEARTFVQYAFTVENGQAAVQITIWRGEPNAAITKALSDLKTAGADIAPASLNLVAGTDLVFSTDPPWPNPFDPPPPAPAPPPPP